MEEASQLSWRAGRKCAPPGPVWSAQEAPKQGVEGTTWSLLISCQNVNAGRLTMEKWLKGNQDSRSFAEVSDPFAVLCRVRDEGPASFFCMQLSALSSTVCWKRCHFLNVFFGLFVKTQVTIEAWAYIWILSATQLINVSVFMQALCCFYCNSFVV